MRLRNENLIRVKDSPVVWGKFVYTSTWRWLWWIYKSEEFKTEKQHSKVL